MTDSFNERKYLRLQAIPLTALPDHPSLAAHQSTSSTATTTTPPPPSLYNLATEILNEAHILTSSTLPEQFKVKGPTTRASAPSTARVELLMAALKAGTGRGADGSVRTDTWFARHSSHVDEAQAGSATWAEFEAGLFVNHSENESDYTPEIFDARQILKWDFSSQNDSTQEQRGASESTEPQLATNGVADSGNKDNDGDNNDTSRVQGWTEVGMSVWEMAHKLPAPLQNRVFAVLVVQGKPTGAAHNNHREFVNAQVPVDLSQFSGAFYSNGKNRQDGANAVQKEKVVVGQYTAAERVRQLGDGHIVWAMATTSDAKGWLPMGMQKLGVPAAIVKDVGLFIGWTDEQRKKKSVTAS